MTDADRLAIDLAIWLRTATMPEAVQAIETLLTIRTQRLLATLGALAIDGQLGVEPN